MSWHVDEMAVRRYQAGAADRVTSASLEAHLTECAECREFLTVDPHGLQRSWSGVAGRVLPGPPSWVERGLTRLGVPSHIARLLAITPSLRISWLLAVAGVLLFSAAASRAGSQSWDLFLMIAPLIPVAGVAVAYGQIVDPSHEMTVSAPFDPVRLLLLRSVAVTSSAVVLSLGVDLATDSPAATGVWLLPALALTAMTLALGTHVTLWMAASASAVTWVGFLLVVAVQTHGRQEAAFAPVFQVMFSLTAAAAGWVLARRIDRYRRGGA
ncbi:MAG: zf-HC2 domain-containing protein [Acidimicrobiia bacterium]